MQKCNGDDTASEAWHLRQPVDVPCGVNDTGFQFVGSVLEQRSPYSYETLEGLLSGALRAELSFSEDDVRAQDHAAV